MSPKQQRLLVVLAFALAIAGLMVFVSTVLRDNFNGYATPTDLTQRELSLGANVSVGGVVVAGSLQAISDPLGSQFRISDGLAEILVVRPGGLPDLFAEGELTEVQGLIVSLDPLTVEATKVLAKHDQYYVPVAAQEAVEQVRAAAESGGE